jgi:hypothetical protein
MAVACGGGGPDTNKVRADFDSPSGKTSDKDAVIAANGKRSAGGGATGAAGALGGFGGFGLSARDVSTGPFADVRIGLVNDMVMRDLRRRTPVSARLQAQESEGISSCFTPDNISVSGGGSSASYSASIDLGSCSGTHTGSLNLEGEFSFDEGTGDIDGVYEVEYVNVCETSSGVCISGSFALEIQQSGQTGTYLMAWDLTTSGGEGGTIATKGGMRYSLGDSTEDYEFLAYVRDSSGVEVSYVMKFTQDAEGNATLSITGSDGSIECTFNADGSGSCSGDYDFDWEEGYADSIESNPAFADYED